MALSTFSGRLRKRPDGIQFSSLPISIPNGLITVHSPYKPEEENDNLQKKIYKERLNKFNLVEINYTSFGCLIDHYWASLISSDAKIDYNILAVLSRPIQHNPSNNGSIVKLFRYENSCYKQELIHTIHLNSYTNCIVMNDAILVVGGSSGVIIYNLKGLIDDDRNVSLDEINLIPSTSILSLHINSTYLIAASVDSIRIWNVNSVLEHMQNPISSIKAIWSYKLNLERVTCMDMTNDYEFLSVCCWDGKVFVFKSAGENDWLIYNPGSSWEDSCQFGVEPYYPAFLTHYEKDGYVLLAVTTPGSSTVRIYDLKSGRLFCQLNENESKDVQGLISVNKALLWIDSNDTIYQHTI